ncbi:hypothetical protein V5O48_009303 [Marasmius crinis-equi]|uniref:Non-haem dioxygenase N-terminal domain-containing protein n=1 Tax=Marasmius crinis-equi TaxID=585013 RepID=A0ABR3FBL4_9AGAR
MSPTNLEPWVAPSDTKAELDWAPLLTVDLSRFDSPGGKQSLAAELKDAVTTWGFWTVVNSGIPQSLIDRHFAIASTFFNQPLEEKRKVLTDYAGGGSRFGYREPREMKLDDSEDMVKQNVEGLNIPKFSPSYEVDNPLHDLIEEYKQEVAEFQRLCYDKVLRRLLVLIAIILELPEDYFVTRHYFLKPSEDHIRMVVPAMSNGLFRV